MPLPSRTRRHGPAASRLLATACLLVYLLAAGPAAGTAADPPPLNAVRDGDATAMRALLADGADVNRPAADGATALHWAARLDRPDVARVLLDAGGRPHRGQRLRGHPPRPRHRQRLGRDARHAAAGMRVLVDLGADPTLTNEDGTTVLMVASGVGIHLPGEDPGTEAEALACVEFALSSAAIPTPSTTAARRLCTGPPYRGANSIVELLVAHGADTFDQENVEGWTPLRIARGVFRTATFKEAPHTAALLGELMAAQPR